MAHNTRNRLVGAAALVVAVIAGVAMAQPLAIPPPMRLFTPAQPTATAVRKSAADRANAGPHITDGTRINNWSFVMTDGGPYTWDLQPNGSLGSGTNSAYGGGMYLQVNNNGFNSSAGVVNKANDEIEVGPWTPDGRVRVSRRVKVYRDRPLARWLDIYENLTGSEVRVNAYTFVNCNWNYAKIVSDSGGASLGERDCALATLTQPGMNPAPPSTCHIFCSRGSKLRPSVQAMNNQVDIRWALTLPPNGTAIICHFESQNSSFDEQVKLMSSFQASKVLRDLPGAVRRLIVNFGASGGFEDVDIERSDKYDVAFLANGDELHGKVLNASFDVTCFFGKVTLAADQVVGMAAAPNDPELARFLLKDGQLVCGRAAGQKLQMQLTAGPTMQVPLERLVQWSFAISAARPADTPAPGGMIMLRTGDRLALDPKALSLTLETLFGPVSLDASALHRVVLDNQSNTVHRALFVNGSSLAGFLQPQTVALPLKLGPRVDISRNMIAEIVFVPEMNAPAPMASLLLSNGDVLLGQLAGGKLSVKTDFGATEVDPCTLKGLTFSEGNPGRAILELWDGTDGLHGDLSAQELSFQLTPGPMVKVPVDHVVEFFAPYAMPPESTLREVAALAAKLQSESWKERQDATDRLVKIGPCVIRVLQERLNDPDAEVRQRAATVIDRINAANKSAPARSRIR